ncbi:MAG: hypothetical protein R6W70_03465 [bacterium]
MNKTFEKYQKYDRRILERKLESGKISKDEYEKFMNSIQESTDYEEINEEELKKIAGITEEEKCGETKDEEESDQKESDGA